MLFFLPQRRLYPAERRLAILAYYDSRDLDPRALKTMIEQYLDSDKGQDIDTIDLRDQTAIADYMIIASGTSSRQVTSMAEKLKERLQERGVKDVRIEGAGQGDWVVIDAGDVIVHLFRPEVREFYNIEKMWRPFTAHEGGMQVTA